MLWHIYDNGTPVIEKNEIYGEEPSVNGSSSHSNIYGMYISSSASPIVTNNLITGGDLYIFEVYEYSYGIVMSGSATATIKGN